MGRTTITTDADHWLSKHSRSIPSPKDRVIGRSLDSVLLVGNWTQVAWVSSVQPCPEDLGSIEQHSVLPLNLYGGTHTPRLANATRIAPKLVLLHNYWL